MDKQPIERLIEAMRQLRTRAEREAFVAAVEADDPDLSPAWKTALRLFIEQSPV